MLKKLSGKSKTFFTYIFIIIVFIGLIYGLSTSEAVYRFELRTLDLRLQLLANNEEHDPNIVQILLNDRSTVEAQKNPELGLGRIPWPRRAWGEVIDFLNRSEPKAIVFNINFIGPEGFSPENLASDAYFTNAVKKSKAPVFFGMLFTDSLKNIKHYDVNVKELLEERAQNVSPDIRELLAAKSLPVMDDLPEGSNMKNTITYTVYSQIMNGLLKEGKGIGLMILKSDADGVNRKNTPLFVFNKNFYPSLSLAVAHYLLPEGQKTLQITEKQLMLGDRVIPLDKEGKNFSTWYGNPGTYHIFDVIDVILSEKSLKKGEKSIEALELRPEYFKDKIVIIGQSATGSDLHHTPVSNVFLGSEIVATNIDNYLNQQKFIQKLDTKYVSIITLIFCLLVWLAVNRSKSTFVSIVLPVMVIVSYVLLSIMAVVTGKLWIDMVAPVAVIILTFVMTYIAKFVLTSRKLESAIEQATKDGLTKLYNHRFFQEKIHKDLANASRKDDKISLCLIDIDFFKKFNDTYGHRAGDAVLIQVAQTLKESVRKSDLVARYGGEEMCVLLDKTDTEEALTVAQKLVDNIQNKDFFIDEGTKRVNVTISIGVATFPAHAKSVQELIEFADKGLYRAKEGGRNRVGALTDEIELTDVPGGDKQIKEVEIQKAKVVKAIEDFVTICNDNNYNHEKYIFNLLKEKTIFSEEFLDNCLQEELIEDTIEEETEELEEDSILDHETHKISLNEEIDSEVPLEKETEKEPEEEKV
jgi:diguanylate cyclase (GGDEF)-like protein